ncbi:MAG: helix-turn-helix domain-containing protein [Planctomycetes bacterium]|nr:helix-turn-helix domain-containing protein [Planctomycetota bacterium]
MPKRKPKKREQVIRRFADRLRELRILRGITQADLAAEAEVSVSYISELESGDTSPGIDLVARLAKGLGTTLSELLPDADPPDGLKDLQDRSRRMFDELLKTADREALLTLAPILSMLIESSGRRQ